MPVNNPRYYSFIVALMFGASGPATAQQPDDAIARCARVATVGDRILCLENTLRQSFESGEPAATDIPAAVPVVTPESASPPTPAETASVAIAAVPTSTSQQPELGAEQVDTRDGATDMAPERIDANIIGHALVLSGRLRLTLDNGQVWQQTTDDDRNIARYLRGEDSVAVEMWRGRSGGYRMYLVPFDRTLRVRRLK